MIKTIRARIRQGYRTLPFPPDLDVLPERFLGRPRIDPEASPAGAAWCRSVCPTGAIAEAEDGMTLDLGKCLFCGECRKAASGGAVAFTREYRLAARRREDLIISSRRERRGRELAAGGKNIFSRSLKLRQVSAGGCNACEADINVLNTLNFDLGRFGIQFVASPRHADGIVVTGPVTANMRAALETTYRAMPAPKLVIAVGACAISGGPYLGHAEAHDGVDSILPVDLYIPGCPPHPWTILDGLLSLMRSP